MLRSTAPRFVLRRLGAVAIVSVMCISPLPMTMGQHPFEKREPQAPLAQPVDVLVSIHVDDAWTYHFGMNQTIATQRQTEDRHDDGPPETTRLIQNATITLRVVSIDEQSGAATVEARFDRLLVITGSDDEQSEFHWSAGSSGREPRTDLDRMLIALAQSTLIAKVSRSGTVRGIVGYDGVNDAIKDNPKADRSALGLFAPSAIGTTLEMIWKPGAVSGAKRNIGDQWTNIRRASLGQIGSVAIEHAINVDRIEGGLLKATGDTDLRVLEPTESPSPGAPQFELLQHEGSMKIAWDLSRGCSASTSEKLDLSALWVLGHARLGVTMRIERSAALDTPPKGSRKPGED